MKDFNIVSCARIAAIKKDNAGPNHNNDGNDKYSSGDDKKGDKKRAIMVWLLGIGIAVLAMFIKPLVGICQDQNYQFEFFLLEDTWQITGILIFISATMSWPKKYVSQKIVVGLGMIVGLLALVVYIILLCVKDINEQLIPYLNVTDFVVLVILSGMETIAYFVGERFVKEGIRI